MGLARRLRASRSIGNPGFSGTGSAAYVSIVDWIIECNPGDSIDDPHFRCSPRCSRSRCPRPPRRCPRPTTPTCGGTRPNRAGASASPSSRHQPGLRGLVHLRPARARRRQRRRRDFKPLWIVMPGGTWVTPTQLHRHVFVTNGVPFFQAGSNTAVTPRWARSRSTSPISSNGTFTYNIAPPAATPRPRSGLRPARVQRREGHPAPELLKRGAWRSRSSPTPIASCTRWERTTPSPRSACSAVLAAHRGARASSPRLKVRRGAARPRASSC